MAKKKLKVGYKYSENLLTSIDSLLSSVFHSGTKSRAIRDGVIESQRSYRPVGSRMTADLKAILVIEGPGRFSALRT